MSRVLFLCAMALFGVMILVLVDRYRLERLRHEADELRMAVETRRADWASLSSRGAT